MLAEYKKKTNIGVGFGILAQFFGRVFEDVNSMLALLILLCGFILFVWGCCSYAKGKGYNSAWGVLGLFSVIGLIILVFFPDKHKEKETEKGAEIKTEN